MLKINVAASMLLAASTVLVAGQQEPAPGYAEVALLAGPTNYVNEVYLGPPSERASFVFIAGEHIAFTIRLANTGSMPVLLSGITGAGGPNLAIRSTPTLRVRLGDTIRHAGPSGPVPLIPANAIQIGPSESLLFDAVVEEPAPRPGTYVVEFATGIVTGDGRKIAPFASKVRFDILASSDETLVDAAYRHGVRAFRAGNYASAERWIEEMLANYPRSYVAYALRGQVAEQAGDMAGAAHAYRAAVTILEAEDDERLNRVVSAVGRQQRLDGLRRRLQEVETRR